MSETSMSTSEREAFLADLHVGVLAVERADGPPMAAPVWYRYSPGGVVEMTTAADAIKTILLRAAGRATLCAQREALPYAYVTVEGAIELGDADRETRIDIASRYLGPEMGTSFVDDGEGGGDSVLVRLTPDRWRTVDYAKVMPG